LDTEVWVSVAKQCLVTGAAGFIGSHMCDLLLAQGHSVTGVDNLATGRLRNVGHLSGNERFAFIEADICDPEAMAGAVAGRDWVFHFAGLADIVPSIQQPLLYHRANVDGTAVLLEASRQTGVGRFLYAASSSCYGAAPETPTPETAPIQPAYPYALTKYLGEQMAQHWCRVYGMPVVSLRLFNVYGPRSRTTGAYGAVFGVFLAQKLAGKPLTVVGDGTQSRDFTFVTDVTRAFLGAAESDISGEVFNIGSGGHYSVNRIVELIGGDRVGIPRRPGEPDVTFADTARFRAATGWAPQVGFEQGVRIMLDNIDAWRDAPVWTPDTIADATADWFKYLS
jgi:UDP-glucose 4-epimerase